jgi:hypothetical protein
VGGGAGCCAQDEVAERAQGMPLVPLPRTTCCCACSPTCACLAARRPPGLDAAADAALGGGAVAAAPPPPGRLRRERGELLVRLGDHLGGAEELETYALVVDGSDGQAPTTPGAKARLARAQLN